MNRYVVLQTILSHPILFAIPKNVPIHLKRLANIVKDLGLGNKKPSERNFYSL